ncbi:MAG TPA: DUF2752 domain-containing protein [Chthoniobacterales bacterium]|nr:DUF2752 domain-containing protein [Chthoniobacterales bacterium]
MRIIRRPLAPAENDYELVWLCVTLVSLALAAGWLAVGLPWPHCVFLALTGHPCVTCGATRCAIAFFHGNFVGAWKWNPLVFVALGAISILDAYAFVVLITHGRRLRLTSFSVGEKNFGRILIVVGLLVNWIYLLSRPPGVF